MNVREIKATGRANLRGNYWHSVFAVFFVTLVMEILASIVFYGPLMTAVTDMLMGFGTDCVFSIRIEGWSMLGFVPLLLLAGPLYVGLSRFFIDNSIGKMPSCGTPFKAAFARFGHNLGGHLYMLLVIALWCLVPVAGALVAGILMSIGARLNLDTLFLIIGVFIAIVAYIFAIAKVYSYEMTTFILGDERESNTKATACTQVSKSMMRGHRWKLFCLQLSFIGWYILNCFTFGLLGLFYINPYYRCSMAAFYEKLRALEVHGLTEPEGTGCLEYAQLEGPDTTCNFQ